MDKYIEMIRIRFLMMLAYRTNYYSGILIYALILVLTTFYGPLFMEEKRIFKGYPLPK